MKRFFLWFGLLLVAVVMAGVTGCASTQSAESKEPVSNLPWNTPQNWEKTAPMGGAMNY